MASLQQLSPHMSIAACFEDDDLLQLILGHLAEADLHAAASLCKRWQTLAIPAKVQLVKQIANHWSRGDAGQHELPEGFRRTSKQLSVATFLADKRAKNTVQQNPDVMASLSEEEQHGFLNMVNSYECGGLPVVLEGDGDIFARQVVASFAHMQGHGLVRPFIIVCPTSRTSFWVDKCARLPSLRVLLNQGSPADRIQAQVGGNWDVLITSYALAIKDLKFLKKPPWRMAVWDDGVRELQRGWRKGSATHNLQAAVSKRGMGNAFCIMLSPTRVTDLKSVNWLVTEHLGSTYQHFGMGTYSLQSWIQSLAKELAPHFAAPRAKGLEECTTIAEEAWLAASQLMLDKVCRPV